MADEEESAPQLRTAHLVLTEVDESDINDMLSIRLADPARLRRTEGPDGYDRAMFERDLMVAGLDPERVAFSVRRRIDERAVGLADILRHHPDDDFFWIGAIEIIPSLRCRGYGREVVDALSEWAKQRGQPCVRCAVGEDDGPAKDFVTRCGFHPAHVTERRGPSGAVSVRVYERDLDACQ